MLTSIFILDQSFPLPQPQPGFTSTVLARDGTPLRSFADRLHIWRHPIALAQVSPHYLAALIQYEDRWFYYHPGINPFSLLRACWQRMRHGRVISGGSTLSMQLARLLAPSPHTLGGKLQQILRALQLELHYSKAEILKLYLQYAPMGGVLEGVEAASRAYLGKSASQLSHAEAALLAVLPQAPSRWRPDRYPERARQARDKVIARMQGIWSAQEIQDAYSEAIYAQIPHPPMLAPLFAQRMRARYPQHSRLSTLLDAPIQASLESLLLARSQGLPPHVSIAALVMDNRELAIRAYAGSADFSDNARFAHVDMVQAERSPGSTLKPFLYGMALDDGLIHSESLLADVPQSFGEYNPANFQQNFHGPVSASEALVKSLNVPAVEVLEQLGPDQFVGRLAGGGLTLKLPRGAKPNLSLILGGAASNLQELVAAYSALDRQGLAGQPRFSAQDPIRERRLLSPGAAFIVRDILESGGPSARAAQERGASFGVAWKTGTSFGFRDAWAIGVNGAYTVGIWVGRPDGTPNPGFFGANVAAPLLMDVFASLPAPQGRPSPPASVSQASICWPDGRRSNGPELDERCPIQRKAWILNGLTPPTFADRLGQRSLLQTFEIDAVRGLRVEAACQPTSRRQIQAARWPLLLEPWLDGELRKRVLPPPFAPGCGLGYVDEARVKISGVRTGALLHRASNGPAPTLALVALGGQGKINWLLNGRLHSQGSSKTRITLNELGRYDITAVDEAGHYDRVSLSLRD